jgi:D-aminopeptidase
MAVQPARDFGIVFNDKHILGHCAPGNENSIVDVQGVCVGHAQFKLGKYCVNGIEKKIATPPPKNVNSGVTAILPLGKISTHGKSARRRTRNDDKDEGYGINTFVPAGWFALNGCGEMTGIHWIEESGILQGPIMLTNTVSVGAVRNAVIEYWKNGQRKPCPDNAPLLPVVAETYDGWLNDILNPLDDDPNQRVDFDMAATDAISNATVDPPLQGNVGGGTGMTCYSWKGGIGTSSRTVQLDTSLDQNDFTVGVLVQANQGTWNELTILGAPVGPIERLEPDCSPDEISECGVPSKKTKRKSSIIVVIATDAPLMPHQLKRLARRAALGIARTGTSSHDDSGELCIAFSTANRQAFNGYVQTNNVAKDMIMLPNDAISPCLFTAAVEATEEAIINALIAADDLEANGHKGCAIRNATDPTTLKHIMAKYFRM